MLRDVLRADLLGDHKLIAGAAKGMKGLQCTPWVLLFAAEYGQHGLLLLGTEHADPEDIAYMSLGVTATDVRDCLESLERIGYLKRTVDGGYRLCGRLWNRQSIPRTLRRQVLERDGHRCTACGGTSALHIDHVIPWSRGGATTLNNLQVLCRGCNLRKGATLPETT